MASQPDIWEAIRESYCITCKKKRPFGVKCDCRKKKLIGINEHSKDVCNCGHIRFTHGMGACQRCIDLSAEWVPPAERRACWCKRFIAPGWVWVRKLDPASWRARRVWEEDRKYLASEKGQAELKRRRDELFKQAEKNKGSPQVASPPGDKDQSLKETLQPKEGQTKGGN